MGQTWYHDIEFTFLVRIYCRSVSVFVFGFHYTVLQLELTTCPLYAGPLIGEFILNKAVGKFGIMGNSFFYYLYVDSYF